MGSEKSNNSRYTVQFSVEDRSASVIICQAVAALEDGDITELPPLGCTLAADELDTLLQSSDTVAVQFMYHGYQVTARGGGSLTVQELE